MKKTFLEIHQKLSEKTMQDALVIVKEAITEKHTFESFCKEFDSQNSTPLSKEFKVYFKAAFEIALKKTDIRLVHEKSFDKLSDAIINTEQSQIIKPNTKSLKKGLKGLWQKVKDFVNNVIQVVNTVIDAVQTGLSDIGIETNWGSFLNIRIKRHSIVENGEGKKFSVMKNGKIAIYYWNVNHWTQIEVPYEGSRPVASSFSNSGIEPTNIFFINLNGELCTMWKDGPTYRYAVINETSGFKIIPGTLRHSKTTGALFALCRRDNRLNIAYMRWYNNTWNATIINTFGANLDPRSFELCNDGIHVSGINTDGKYCTTYIKNDIPPIFDGTKYAYAVVEPDTHDLDV